MITAWVLYSRRYPTQELSQFKFEELTGTNHNSSNPADWGLDPNLTEIILVLQKAQFLGAWLTGNKVR